MGHLSKKADGGLTILVIIIVVVFLGWVVNISQRECKSNKDCGSEAYCGSDFACHTYPVIQKTVVQYNFFFPSIIIGIAIIVAAALFNWNKIKSSESYEKKEEEQVPEQKEAMEVEPYYKSGTERTP